MSLDLDEEPIFPSDSAPSDPPPAPTGDAVVRGGFSRDSVVLVTEDVAAIRSDAHIQFVFLNAKRRWRTFAPAGARGVGAIAGRDDLGVLAWSDLGPKPDVHVLQYPDTKRVLDLPGENHFRKEYI